MSLQMSDIAEDSGLDLLSSLLPQPFLESAPLGWDAGDDAGKP